MQKKIDEAAILWNKTKNPKYKNLWYKLIKEFANVQDANNINTFVRRNIVKREL